MQNYNPKSKTEQKHHNYARAVIVTSDGDFACLVKYLRDQDKLSAVISPSRRNCSSLLRKAAAGYISFIEDNLRPKLEYKKTPPNHKD
ncbi:MAG: hypothetical protein A3J48_01475 [Candidatus Doudnabacteria bacterium RIFCSPHIGHO2_02_FULL_46_11]|uniref:NYN domain-containing protein n=1 Tax=Candidatus Doudnabacteria bacterium RIFCSPHIGHO2_02_FULL_46_11 TaxID=1817832 RepID=A0A1F5P8J2_9BACT|nr:MAG: hypothetical protein A3J48_01475 [Candidatus Doudnabacteria bacterium RIFCSPHIGHO2_02_FULL_46_11]